MRSPICQSPTVWEPAVNGETDGGKSLLQKAVFADVAGHWLNEGDVARIEIQ
jgi:hypothetical protein